MNKVFIAIPCGEPWVNIKLAEWMMKNYNSSDGEFHFEYKKPLEVCIAHIIDKFLRTDCTHILFIDNDIIPYDDLGRNLLRADKDIVGAAVLTWRKEFEGPRICARIRNKDGTYKFIKPNGGLQKVDFVGFGCVLIKRKVFECVVDPKMPRSYSMDMKQFKGMDLLFCERADQMGFEIYCDTSVIVDQIVDNMSLKEIYDKMNDIAMKSMRCERPELVSNFGSSQTT